MNPNKRNSWPVAGGALTAGEPGENQMSAVLEKPKNNASDLPNRKSVETHFVNVTPEIASQWLTFNRNNRVITRKKVDEYAADMLAGKWRENGDTIRFSNTAKLLDGQQRLTAIVETGLKIRVLVVTGLDDESQPTMDTGRPRKGRDVLEIEGLEPWESKVAATALNLIINHDQGKGIHFHGARTNQEIRDYWLEHPRVASSLRVVKALPRVKPVIKHSQALALHYIFSRQDEHAATAFVEALFDGVNISRDSALYHLRDMLLRDAMSGKRRSAYDMYYMVITAWNRDITGKKTSTNASLRPNQDRAFPEVGE